MHPYISYINENIYQIIQWTVSKCTQFIFPSIANIYPSIDLMKNCLMKTLVSLQNCMNFNYWVNYSFNVCYIVIWLWSLRLPGGFTPQTWIARISIRRGTITRGPYRCPCTGTCTHSHPPSDSLSIPAFLWGVTWDLFRLLYTLICSLTFQAVLCRLWRLTALSTHSLPVRGILYTSRFHIKCRISRGYACNVMCWIC